MSAIGKRPQGPLAADNGPGANACRSEFPLDPDRTAGPCGEQTAVQYPVERPRFTAHAMLRSDCKAASLRASRTDPSSGRYTSDATGNSSIDVSCTSGQQPDQPSACGTGLDYVRYALPTGRTTRVQHTSDSTVDIDCGATRARATQSGASSAIYCGAHITTTSDPSRSGKPPLAAIRSRTDLSVVYR